MSVLIVSNENDHTSDVVVEQLEHRGAPVFRLNTERIPDYFSFGISIAEGQLSGSFRSIHRGINLSEITSVYYRRPLDPPLPDLESGDREFARRETRSFLRWLWFALSDRYWLSKPHCIRQAESKPYQLQIAHRLGFHTPKTIITNDPEEARRFFLECDGRVVTKSLAGGFIERDGDQLHVYTTPLSEEHLDNLSGVKFCPTVFQERIEKLFELRVTVVRGQVFAAEIHSQQNDRTRDDWRRYDLDNTPHKQHSLPSVMAEACIKLVSSFGLEFGAIDLIFTPQGEYVFLELNPNGQWLWIEGMTGLPILNAIVEALLDGGG